LDNLVIYDTKSTTIDITKPIDDAIKIRDKTKHINALKQIGRTDYITLLKENPNYILEYVQTNVGFKKDKQLIINLKRLYDKYCNSS
jgi:hypothetical protein